MAAFLCDVFRRLLANSRGRLTSPALAGVWENACNAHHWLDGYELVCTHARARTHTNTHYIILTPHKHQVSLLAGPFHWQYFSCDLLIAYNSCVWERVCMHKTQTHNSHIWTFSLSLSLSISISLSLSFSLCLSLSLALCASILLDGHRGHWCGDSRCGSRGFQRRYRQ
jgi:hypothetical protein